MYPFNEFVPWASVQTRRSEAMAVSPALNVMVLACENNGSHNLGDFVQVYDMTKSLPMSLCYEFVVDHVLNSANLVFTAEDLLVMANRSGELCLIDIRAQCQTGVVGSPTGYFQGACSNLAQPFCVAAGPGHVVVGYSAFCHDDLSMHDDDCMASQVRIFKGSHTAWTLHHVVHNKKVGISMQVVPSTGLLAVAAHERRFRQDGLMGFEHYQLLETYQIDPWELKDICNIGTAFTLNSDENGKQPLVDVQESGGRENEWLVLQETRVCIVRSNACGSATHQGALALDGKDFAMSCAWHPSGALVVLRTNFFTLCPESTVTLYAHPDVIAMASMSDLRVAWIAAVVCHG